MRFGTWDILFNILLLLFWFRIWSAEERNVFFNPYLAPLGRVSESAVNFLRPVFFGMRVRQIAAVALVFLIFFRSIIFHGVAGSHDASWVLRLGFERQIDTGSFISCLIFSFLSFGVFLFKLWGISLVFVRTASSASFDHTTGTLYYLSRPFPNVRPKLRPVLLLAFGMLLAFLLDLAGVPKLVPQTIALPVMINWTDSPFLVNLLKLAISALAGWVDLLLVIQTFLILLIIGSWISMFMASRGIMFFCREWMDMILGPLRRHPIRIGMFDLTPLIFILAIQFFIYPLLKGILFASYSVLA